MIFCSAKHHIKGELKIRQGVKIKIKLLLLLVFVSLSSLLFSTIWEVNQDGSGDFTTVQAGIDQSANMDTVLVYPGIYYENLEIIDKFITLGSLYLTTGDEFYIPYTILDGNQESSVIRIENVPSYTNLTISGFVIQNGIGYNAFSDDRQGGGLYIENSKVSMNNCIIQHNNTNNSGGGISLNSSILNLSGNTIRFNKSDNRAGGIDMYYQSSINYDTEFLNNIYLNYSGVGNDMFIGHSCPFQEVVLDTFTVLIPDDDNYLIYPSSDGMGYPLPDRYSTDIQNGYVEQVDHDIFVSTDGDDNNSGLSILEPLQTIAYALVKINADSLEQKSIHISDGVYTASQNNQIWPLQIKSYIGIIGESRENTLLDAELTEGFFRGGSGQSNYKIENLSLINHRHGQDIFLDGNANAYFNNVYMADSQTARSIVLHFSDVTLNRIINEDSYPGSIYLYSPNLSTQFTIKNSRISNLYGNIPLSIYRAIPLSDSLIINIINTEVSNNEVMVSPWLPTCSGIKVEFESKLNLINSSVCNNFSTSNGSGVLISYNSEANIVNSVLYGNLPYNIGFDNGQNILSTNNSLIGGGIDGILNMGTNLINWDDLTMLDEDPLWLGAGYEFPYSLSVNSPCIDTGTLELPYGVELPAYDLAGNPRVMGSNIDMGAYEYPGNAAPIYLEVNNENLNWQIPPGFAPVSYNVYLDDEFQANVSAFQMEYVLQNLVIGQSYKIGVSAVYAGEETAIIPKYFTYNPVGIEETTHLSPLASHLSNYPNPFNPSTTISFSVTQTSSFVNLSIFNIKGQKVKTLVNARLSSGDYNISWNGRDSNNKRVSTGEYLAKLKVNGTEEEVLKIMLLK